MEVLTEILFEKNKTIVTLWLLWKYMLFVWIIYNAFAVSIGRRQSNVRVCSRYQAINFNIAMINFFINIQSNTSEQ